MTNTNVEHALKLIKKDPLSKKGNGSDPPKEGRWEKQMICGWFYVLGHDLFNGSEGVFFKDVG